MKITAVRVIVTCPAGQACTLLQVQTDAGVCGWVSAPRRRPRGDPRGRFFADGCPMLPGVPGPGVDIEAALAARRPYERNSLPAPRRAEGSLHGY